MDTDTSRCRELILDDVVAIALWGFGNTSFDRPQTVTSTYISVLRDIDEIARFHVTDESAQFLMPQTPTVSLSTARSEQGLIYTHELSIPLAERFSKAESLVTQLQDGDFAVAYEKADGGRSISYPLPGTVTATIEESISSAASATIKIKMQSMSGLIILS